MSTVFITKYALTGGILELPLVKRGNGMVTVKRPGISNGDWDFFGNDWHPTREEAVKRAEDMRQAKIKSLQKQIAKLEKLSF